MNNKEYIKCYPCFSKDVNGNILVDPNINDPYNLNGSGSKCQEFDISFPNKNKKPKDYLVCRSTDKLNNSGCGIQEYIIPDKNGHNLIKQTNTTGLFILSIIVLISVYSIIMGIIYKASKY